MVAAVAAGVICTGTGISTAATDTSGPGTTDAPQSGLNIGSNGDGFTVETPDRESTAYKATGEPTFDQYDWKVINYTAKPLTEVQFEKWDESVVSSDRTESSWLVRYSIAEGGSAATTFYDPSSVVSFAANHTHGTLCYDGTRWELPGQKTTGNDWHEVGIFAGPNGKGGEQLIATPKGAHDDRGLVYRGSC